MSIMCINNFSARICTNAMQNLHLNPGSQTQTKKLRHKFETLLNQVKDFDTILVNISDTSETVTIAYLFSFKKVNLRFLLHNFFFVK